MELAWLTLWVTVVEGREVTRDIAVWYVGEAARER